MTEQTLKQTVDALLKEFDDLENEFFYSEVQMDSEYNEDRYTELDEKAKELGITFTHEDNHGGEGQGDDYWSVYKFTRGDESVYVKFQGWYASYNGAEFNQRFFVTPKQVEVTVYE